MMNQSQSLLIKVLKKMAMVYGSSENSQDLRHQNHIAVLAAIDAMRQCCPNGRNAYMVDGLMERLKAQYQARQEYLQAVADSLEAEAIALQEGSER